jgi:hypothetical protein
VPANCVLLPTRGVPILACSLLTTCHGFRYYELHGESLKATALMNALARDEADCAINVRVGYLQRAVASAERASAQARNGEDAQMASELLLDLRDTLEIAGEVTCDVSAS